MYVSMFDRDGIKLFFFPDQLVTEKEGGVLERELSTGMTILQLLMSQMMTQCLARNIYRCTCFSSRKKNMFLNL